MSHPNWAHLLAELTINLSDPNYRPIRDLNFAIANDPKFQKAFGSHERHHAYEGGLLNHTLEVLKFSIDMARGFREQKWPHVAVNCNVLVTAAVFHDYMKIREYDREYDKDFDDSDFSPKIVKTDYREKIRHVAGSYAEFLKRAELAKLNQGFIDAVGHCILAHHGRQEWGSPIEPQTLEAFILHSADMLSMQYGPTKVHDIELTKLTNSFFN